jgi:hypothetical protein
MTTAKLGPRRERSVGPWDEMRWLAWVEGTHVAGVGAGSAGEGDGDGDGDGDKSALENLRLAIFRFSRAAIAHHSNGNPFHNPLGHFTAVLAIDARSEYTLRGPFGITPIFAGVQYMCRLIMLESGYHDLPPEPDVIPSAEQMRAFDAEYDTYMLDNYSSPYDSLVSDMCLANGFKKLEKQLPTIAWTKGDDGGPVLLYKTIRVPVAAFRALACQVRDNALSLADRLFFGHLNDESLMPAFKFAQIKDHPSEFRLPGQYAIFNDAGNFNLLESGIDLLIDLARHPSLAGSGRRIWSENATFFDETAARL